MAREADDIEAETRLAASAAKRLQTALGNFCNMSLNRTKA
jgi:hypothetical protein